MNGFVKLRAVSNCLLFSDTPVENGAFTWLKIAFAKCLSETAMSVFENMINTTAVYLSDGNWLTIQSHYPTQTVDIFNITTTNSK
jgi:hypothetical protein